MANNVDASDSKITDKLIENEAIEGGNSTIETQKNSLNKRSLTICESEKPVMDLKSVEELKFVKSEKKNKCPKSPKKQYTHAVKLPENTDSIVLQKVSKPIRKDNKGVIIQKKGKKHKIMFIDEVDPKKNLIDICVVDNYKAYNKEASNDKDYKEYKEDQANTKCSCTCIIF